MNDQQNGNRPPVRRQLGRRAPEPPLFTFPGSGVTIGLYPASPDTINAIHRQVMKENPMPTPATRSVQVGDEVDGVNEQEEVHDPKFAEELWAYHQKTATEIGKRLFKLAMGRMVFDIDEEALNVWKAEMAAIEVDIDTSLTDKELYVRNIVIARSSDVDALMDYFMSQSQPTEAVVKEYKASFQGDVQPEGHMDDRASVV